MNYFQFSYALEMRDMGLDYASKAVTNTNQEKEDGSGISVDTTREDRHQADMGQALA